jgi:hypothetical protein
MGCDECKAEEEWPAPQDLEHYTSIDYRWLLVEGSARVEDVVMVTEKGGVPFSNYQKELTTI